MTIRNLEIFVAVCQEGSITKAAQRLYVSQPTVSVAIKEMEDEYGQQLFDNLSRKKFLTPFGHTVFDYATRLLNIYSEMSELNSSMNTIRISSGTAVGKLYMPVVVKSFMEKHPGVRISNIVGDTTRMFRLAMDNSVDFTIAETVDNLRGLSHTVLQRYPIVAACRKDNPITKKEVVTADDLYLENLLLREPTSLTRTSVDQYFLKHNHIIEPMWMSYSVQALMNAASEGLGVSFLSLDHVLAYRNPDLVILNIPDFKSIRLVNVCYHKDKVFTPIVNEFIDYYKEKTGEIFDDGVAYYMKHHPDSSYKFD